MKLPLVASPAHVVLLMLAGWLNREQQRVTAYLVEENRVLREQLPRGRLPLTKRFIRSVRNECMDRVIPLGEAHLRELLREYVAHYHAGRPHQGLGGAFIEPANDNGCTGRIVRRERLGGLWATTTGRRRDAQSPKHHESTSSSRSAQ